MKNPSGICMCGCGEATPLSASSRRGYKRGEPLRYIKGHSTRAQGPDYVVDENGCWLWKKSIGSLGYGRIWNGVGHDMAHRVYYERESGPIPVGHDVHHRCSVPRCVNPEHLIAVSRAEHMALEGRAPYGNPKLKAAAA